MTPSAERASAEDGRLDVPEAALVAARAADAKLGRTPSCSPWATSSA